MAAAEMSAVALTRRYDSFQQYNEALHDSKSLQSLAGDILGSLQRKHYELLQTPKIEDDISCAENAALNSIESLIIALHDIRKDIDANVSDLRKDIDANIKDFKYAPLKTFFQVNVEQLTAIYQLRSILPSLQPFLPDTTTGASISRGHANSTNISGVQGVNDEWTRIKGAACFDRERRSASVVPLAQHPERDVKMASLGTIAPWKDEPEISPQSSLSEL